MLVKFIPTRIKGTSIDAVLSYIFQQKDASGRTRPTVRQVAGTMPELLSLMSLGVNSKTPYTHSVLTFSDADMIRTTEVQRLEILHSYIDELSAGLGDNGLQRMPYIAVDHGNHIHCITLRFDSYSGKVYQPFVVSRGDTQRFNAMKDVINAKYGLDSPTKGRALFRLDAKHVPEAAQKLAKLLNDVGADVVKERGEIEPQELVEELESVIQREGFKVARVIRSGFSVTTPTMKRHIRIKFTEKAMGKPERAVVEDVDELRERLACHRERLMQHMGRYHEGKIPEVRQQEVLGGDMSDQSTFNRHCMFRNMANEIHHISAMA